MRIIKQIYPLILLTACVLPMWAQVTPVDVYVPAVDGIDVSDHQRTIDWDAVARDKRVQFVYIKATEGATYTSRVYRYNLEHARRAGIKVGSYHFLRTGSRIRDQFDNFSRVVKKHEQDLLPLIDVEVRQGWTNQQVRDSVKLFADLCEQHYGVRPMIYTSAHFFNHILGRAFADYPLFIARYAANEPVLDCGSWILWQYSEKGSISGIDTPVDLSCFNRGCGLQNILIKENRMGSRRRSASEAVEGRDKPSSVKVKEAPAMSKKQEKELKKQQEKERKARERAEKLQREEAAKQQQKQRKAEEEQRKRAMQQAHDQQKKLEEQKKKQEDQQKKLEEQRKKDEKKRQEQAQQEQERQRKLAEQQRKRNEVEQRQKQQQAQDQAAKQAQKDKQRQQRETVQRNRLDQTATSVRQSTRSRKTNKSSADND
ncbi:MAG: hypothetical protein IJT30_10105 [Muribaculaceae bacterium]|nr:hypothetical protein [Muribaculaceae bacterium]